MKENKLVTKERAKLRRGVRLPKNEKGLTEPEVLFIDKYMETNNATEAALYAGYSARTAHVKGCQLLKEIKIVDEINRRLISVNKEREKLHQKSIATSTQVMEFLTQVMNGEIKDQFGLEAPLAERTKAAVELAKRTVDVENRVSGKADGVLEIKLDWSRDD